MRRVSEQGSYVATVTQNAASSPLFKGNLFEKNKY